MFATFGATDNAPNFCFGSKSIRHICCAFCNPRHCVTLPALGITPPPHFELWVLAIGAKISEKWQTSLERPALTIQYLKSWVLFYEIFLYISQILFYILLYNSMCTLYTVHCTLYSIVNVMFYFLLVHVLKSINNVLLRVRFLFIYLIRY